MITLAKVLCIAFAATFAWLGLDLLFGFQTDSYFTLFAGLVTGAGLAESFR